MNLDDQVLMAKAKLYQLLVYKADKATEAEAALKTALISDPQLVKVSRGELVSPAECEADMCLHMAEADIEQRSAGEPPRRPFRR